MKLMESKTLPALRSFLHQIENIPLQREIIDTGDALEIKLTTGAGCDLEFCLTMGTDVNSSVIVVETKYKWHKTRSGLSQDPSGSVEYKGYDTQESSFVENVSVEKFLQLRPKLIDALNRAVSEQNKTTLSQLESNYFGFKQANLRDIKPLVARMLKYAHTPPEDKRKARLLIKALGLKNDINF